MDNEIIKKKKEKFQKAVDDYNKIMKEVINETYGAHGTRLSDITRETIWDGITFVKDIKDVNGFLSYIGNLNSYVSSKTPSRYDTLDNYGIDGEILSFMARFLI